MRNIFETNDTDFYIKSINTLSADSPALWGKMSVDQMLAHCNVTYETIYEPHKHKKPGFLAHWILKTFVKKKVTSTVPYKQNLPTAPMFLMTESKNFEEEKKRLIGFIQKTQQLGQTAFEGKENISFGVLSAKEWNNMMAKHLDHHLKQFNAID